jgi:DNA-binding transcriptional LysR family regulator
VADLHAKHAMIRANLGWGNLPEHLIASDLRARRLVAIRPEGQSADEQKLLLFAVHRGDTTFGPAHRWVLGQLENLCTRETSPPARRRARPG